MIAPSSSPAAAAPTPGTSRPTTNSRCESRTVVMSPGNGKLRGMPRSLLTQISMSVITGIEKSAGSTPMMCVAVRRALTLVPRPWRRSRTGVRRGRGSARPPASPPADRLPATACGRSAACTPRMEKKRPDAPAARSRSGSPRPVRLAAKLSNAASDSNDRASRAQSRIVGRRHPPRPGCRRRFPRHHQATGVGERQRPQHHCVQHGKDGGVGADAERQGNDCGKRESGLPPPQSECVSHGRNQEAGIEDRTRNQEPGAGAVRMRTPGVRPQAQHRKTARKPGISWLQATLQQRSMPS